MKKNFIASLCVLLAVVLVFGAAITGLNTVTAPIIKKNQEAAAAAAAAAKAGAMFEMIPGATGFEQLYGDGVGADLTVLNTVKAIHKETSGLGFVVACETTSKYSDGPMQFMMGIDANNGAICGMKMTNYQDSMDFSKDFDYPATYVGQNSTLADVQLVAGCTFSSTAFKNAVADAFAALAANGLMAEAKKADSQILKELIPTVQEGFANESGALQVEDIAGSGKIKNGFKAKSGAGYAFIVEIDTVTVLAVVDAEGNCRVYDVEGKDVTAANATVVTEATAAAAAANSGELLALVPESTGFVELDLTTLTGIPTTVTAIRKEVNGLGFVVACETTSQYSAGPMQFMMGIDANGAVCGMKMSNYQESIDFSKSFDYPATYVGQNSTLADVQLVAGCTYSSTAFKNAVADAFAALAANGLMAEAKKADSQILTELIPTVHTGLVNGVGAMQTEDVAGSGNIEKGFKAKNGSGYAFIVKAGDASVLAVVNAAGNCRVYDVEGKDVTAANAAVVAEATAAAATNPKVDAEIKKFTTMLKDSTVTPKSMDGVFSTVTGVYEIKLGEETYTGIVSRSYGYEIMGVYYILDANGAIVKMTADEIIFHAEYFATFAGLDEGAYKNGFVGLTKDTFDGSAAMIATATMSSEGVKSATNDIFAAFEIVKGGA